MTFRKRRAGVPPDYFAAEAAGLRWLAVSGGPPVVAVLDVGRDFLDLARLPSGAATETAAVDFGRRLAVMHRAGADAFGAAPAGYRGAGFIADLPLPYGSWDAFGPFYAEARVRPYVDLLPRPTPAVFTRLMRALHEGDTRLVGPPESPARLHGDLWSGNVMWSPRPANSSGPAVAGWLIDPAAHGGHRETDLAMLALFGAPHLTSILDGYQQAHRLAPSWRRRVSLHQVHPLLVHAVLFGGGYLQQAMSAATAALAAVSH